MENQTELSNYSKIELVETYDNIRHQIDDLEAARSELGKEILSRMKDDAEMWGKKSVTKVVKTSFTKVPLTVAKSLGAIKEAIDTAVLGKLQKKGIQIEGATQTTYVLVKDLEPKE